jgi:hypothetical protein
MALREGELVPGAFSVVVVAMLTVTRVVVPPAPVTFKVKKVGAVAGTVTTVPTVAPWPCRECGPRHP